jgi:hypothetical protein
LLHQQSQCFEPATPGRDFELAGLGVIAIQHGPRAQAPREAAAGDVVAQFLDGHASLDAPHVGLAQHQFVERDIPRRRQRDFLDSFRHQIFFTTGAGSHSTGLTSAILKPTFRSLSLTVWLPKVDLTAVKLCQLNSDTV